jgi:hypothetical protein
LIGSEFSALNAVCPLEKGRLRAHIYQMAPLNKCLDALRPLIAEGDTNGIATAEKAVDEYLAATSPPARKGALHSVQQVVQTHREAASGSQQSFADAVNDYIEKLMRGLE